ncbi:MAG: nucleoside recognition domain-containing protein [Lachnospiraceae bacterium]|nr:spore maturation protein [Robinsoniella sp.]MDY3765974.1 nucleoside recognition domain-containing protein [Lachnospiraceae bacterium]
MKILSWISEMMIPFLIFYIVGYGMIMGISVYDTFTEGAKKGMTTVVKIMPTMIGLMVGVGVLRASGFLDFLSNLIGKVTEKIGVSAELVPVMIVRMFSNSAATGLLLDLFQNKGVDSQIGRTAAIMMSSTETIFYTMSIYFMAVKVTKTRYTFAGALLATISGVVISVILAGRMI